jgi:hypothetical protein
MPQIGEVSPGMWLASGFGGHGLNTTAMAGELLARCIVENDDAWKLFLPFELVWAGGRIGRVASQVHYWWYRANERRRSREAREREVAPHRGDALARTANELKVRRPAPAEAGQRVRAAPQPSSASNSDDAEVNDPRGAP